MHCEVLAQCFPDNLGTAALLLPSSGVEPLMQAGRQPNANDIGESLCPHGYNAVPQ
jgi:hypothetical protein